PKLHSQATMPLLSMGYFRHRAEALYLIEAFLQLLMLIAQLKLSLHLLRMFLRAIKSLHNGTIYLTLCIICKGNSKRRSGHGARAWRIAQGYFILYYRSCICIGERRYKISNVFWVCHCSC